MITESREIDRWQDEVAGKVVLTEHPPGGWFVLESVGEDGIVRSVDSLTNPFTVLARRVAGAIPGSGT